MKLIFLDEKVIFLPKKISNNYIVEKESTFSMENTRIFLQHKRHRFTNIREHSYIGLCC